MTYAPIVVAAVTTSITLLGPAVAAGPPEGSATTCAPTYSPMTLPDLLQQAERLGIPEQRARALFARVNKNEDAWICQRKLPGEETDINFIDNQAVGLDRRDR